MSVIDGFKNMSWVISGYDGTEQVYFKRIDATGVSEERIKEILRELAIQHLTPDEIKACNEGRAPFLTVQADENNNRLAYMIGENPHYIAGLFRADETPK